MAAVVLGSWVGRDSSNHWLLDPPLPPDTAREGRASCFGSAMGWAPKPGSGVSAAAVLVGLAGGTVVRRRKPVGATGEVGPCPAWRPNKKQGERSRSLLPMVCLFQIPLGASICQEGL